MKLAALALVGLLAGPASANLADDYQTQQNQQEAEQARRTELCNNHRANAQFVAVRDDNYLYRISRGDLYQIRWTGEMNDPYRFVKKPCEVTLIGRIDTDTKVCQRPSSQSWGCDPRSTTRWTVEGNELVSYSTMNFTRGSYTGTVRRSVLATKL